MKITLTVEDVPADRVERHPHRSAAVEQCWELGDDLDGRTVAGLVDEVGRALAGFLLMWDYGQRQRGLDCTADERAGDAAT